MKKYICIICMMMWVMLTACGTDAKFNGSRTSDEKHFYMVYSILNIMDSQNLEMNAGDIIDVEIVSNSGNVSVTIQKGDDEPIYSGNELPTSSFSVHALEDGIYTITVTGNKASGSVSFIVRNDND